MSSPQNTLLLGPWHQLGAIASSGLSLIVLRFAIGIRVGLHPKSSVGYYSTLSFVGID